MSHNRPWPSVGTDLELVSISLIGSVGYFPSCWSEQNRYSGFLTQRTYPHCRSGRERGRTEEAAMAAALKLVEKEGMENKNKDLDAELAQNERAIGKGKIKMLVTREALVTIMM